MNIQNDLITRVVDGSSSLALGRNGILILASLGVAGLCAVMIFDYCIELGGNGLVMYPAKSVLSKTDA